MFLLSSIILPKCKEDIVNRRANCTSNEDVTERLLRYVGRGITECLINVCSQSVSSSSPSLLIKSCTIQVCR